MMLICCDCDWDLGGELPPHYHVDKELLQLPDGRQGWMPKGTAALNPSAAVLVEWPEIAINVDWKTLYREATR